MEEKNLNQNSTVRGGFLTDQKIYQELESYISKQDINAAYRLKRK
ncbi:MAG: hypothetical protein Q9M89_02530 [Persephonella sp.]|nr:hypothetical protein [Persephonella sp.]